MKRSSWLVSILLLGSLAAPSSAGRESRAEDQNGETHVWRAPLPELTVFDFAASWCAPCRFTLPMLEGFSREFPEVRILVVSVDDEVSGRDDLVNSLDLTLPVVWDAGYEIAEHFQPDAMPSTFVVDTDGKVIYRHGGSAEESWNEFVMFMKEELEVRADGDEELPSTVR